MSKSGNGSTKWSQCYKCFYSKMMGHRMADCRKRKVNRTDTRNYKTNCALVVRGARNPIE